MKISSLRTCLLFCVAAIAPDAYSMQLCDLRFSNGTTIFAVPVAATLAEQEQGLSKTHEVGPGMLFLWRETATRTFWMRNTWIPLDIGFFDGQGNPFQIEHMVPNTDTRYKSERPAQFALEMASEQYKTLGLMPGVSFTVSDCVARKEK